MILPPLVFPVYAKAKLFHEKFFNMVSQNHLQIFFDTCLLRVLYLDSDQGFLCLSFLTKAPRPNKAKKVVNTVPGP